MASPTAYLFLSLLFLAATQSPAEPNPVEILTKDTRFTTLLELLKKADLVGALAARLNTTTGITLIAPTDNAFGKIIDTLVQLSESDKKTILLYHALDKYVKFSNLEVEGQARTTLAPGLTLNFTRANGLVNVSTGVVNTVVGSLYDTYPLGIFPVEDVLIPPNFASSPEPSTPPTSGGNSPPPPAGSVAPPPAGSVVPPPAGSVLRPPAGSVAPPPKSAARFERVGWRGLIPVVVVCMSLSL